jgi:alpha-tubulin suppressor-like RCC1 family protein
MQELLSFLPVIITSVDTTHSGTVGVDGKLYAYGHCGHLTGADHQLLRQRVHIPLPWPITSVSCSDKTTAVVNCEGNVYLRGDVVTRYPDTETTYPDWTAIPFPEPIVSTEIGYRCLLLLTLSGKVYSIGNHDDGQLGIGGGLPSVIDNVVTYTGVDKFTLVDLPFPCCQLKLKCSSVCALTVDGSLYTWGHNSDGKLRLGKFLKSPTPVKVTLPKEELVASVELTTFMLVLTVTGREYICGGSYNWYERDEACRLRQLGLNGLCRQMSASYRPTTSCQVYSKLRGVRRILTVTDDKVTMLDDCPRCDNTTRYFLLDVIES